MQNNEITQIYQAIASVSQKINEVQSKLDSCFSMLHSQNEANIDYLAMMADIEIPTENEEEMPNE